MRSMMFVAIFLPVVACAQAGQRGRNGPAGQGGFPQGGIPATPEQVIAPNVPVATGLPHAVKVGFVVYVSGMVPLDSAGRLISGDFAAQAKQAVGNLAAVVEAARGVPGDLVRVTAYVRDITPERVEIVRNAILDGLDRSTPPAVTIVGVAALGEPGAELTVDGTAQLRGEFPDRSRMRR